MNLNLQQAAQAVLDNWESGDLAAAVRQLDAALKAAPVAGGLYLELFHGRKSPDEELDDWGSQGAIFGPLQFAHTTYASDVKMQFKDGSDGWLHITKDSLVYYDGVYYGDWSLFDKDGTEGQFDERIRDFDQALAELPEGAATADKPEVLITVEGGCMRSVYADQPVRVQLYDYDDAKVAAEDDMANQPPYDWTKQVGIMPEGTDWDAFAKDPENYAPPGCYRDECGQILFYQTVRVNADHCYRITHTQRGHLLTLGMITPTPDGDSDFASSASRDNLERALKQTGEVVEDIANAPCKVCGRTDLPLHYNRCCPECFTPKESA